MKKGKKVKRRDGKSGKKEEKKEGRAADVEVQDDANPGRQFPLISLFKNDEIQEVKNLTKISDLNDSHVLLAAVVLGKFDIVKRLLREGLPIDECGEDGITALSWSIKQMQFEMVDFLINRGASLTHTDAEGNTAILVALQTESWDQDAFIDLWNSVKDQEIDLNHANKVGNTLIHYVVRRQWQNVLQIVIEKGINLNCLTSKGVTALMLACSKHHEALVQCLLRNRAKVTIEDQKGCTALCYSLAYMIQKKIVRIDGTVNLIMDATLPAESPYAKTQYIRRRLDLLCNPPDVSSYAQTLNNVVSHVFTFVIRFLDRGVEDLLNYYVFRKIKESIDKHLENRDYIAGLLSILSELLRHCDCCTSNLNQHKILTAFHEASLLNSCLKILKRHPDSLLEPIFLIFIHTCWNLSTKQWLQANFKGLSEHYNDYILNCIPVYNFYPDDAHNQIVRKNSQAFKNLCSSLLKGEIIAQEPEKPKVKKNKKELRSVRVKDIHQPETPKSKMDRSDGLIHISSVHGRSPSKTRPRENGVYWASKENLKSDGYDDKVIYPRWQEDFREGCELFGIPIEPVKVSDNVWEDEEKAKPPNDVEETINELDKMFYGIMDKYSVAWNLDYKSGYPTTTIDRSDYYRLLNLLPRLEEFHEEEVKKKWENLSQTLKDYWKEHRTAADLPLENVKAFLKAFQESADERLNEENIKPPSEPHESLYFKDLPTDGIDSFKADFGEGVLELPVKTPEPVIQDEFLLPVNKEVETFQERCRKGSKRKISPPPGFEESPKRHQSLESLQRDRVNLYDSDLLKDRVEELRVYLGDAAKESNEDIYFPPDELQIHYTVGDGGNFGRVVLGLDKDFYPVAFKQVLRTESLSSQLLAANLMHCLREILDIQKDVVLPYTVLCDLKGEAVFATPLCQRNLDMHMKALRSSGQYTLEVAKEMSRQLVEGLHFLHTYDSPIIHGNLKPTNALIDNRGCLRLADFGLSSVLHHLKHPCLSTFTWWAQESISYFQSKYQYVAKLHSDIQVCGMLIHYICTGGMHPHGTFVEEIVCGIMKGQPRLLTIDPNIKDLIAWMVNHAPEARPKMDMVFRHIALWSPSKVIQFLYTCMGEQGFNESSSSLAEFHNTIDQYSKENGIDTQWVERLKEEYPAAFKRGMPNYPNTLSGILKMCRAGLPQSMEWFLVLFPTVPLSIYRILYETRWSTRPEFHPFV